eukprot:5017826-Pyramimonas_sp.AAC.1
MKRASDEGAQRGRDARSATDAHAEAEYVGRKSERRKSDTRCTPPSALYLPPTLLLVAHPPLLRVLSFSAPIPST